MGSSTALTIPDAIFSAISALPGDVPISITDIKELAHLSKYFPTGFLGDNKLLPDQIKTVLEGLVSSISEHRTLPLRCTGSKCAIRHICPFEAMGIAPVGQECALERISMDQWKTDYIISLNINARDKIAMGLIDELVEIDIFNKYRFPAVLSENISSFQEEVTRYSDRTGAVVEKRKEVSKAFEAKMLMAKRREVIMKELMATPREKSRIPGRKKNDISSEVQDIMEKAEDALIDQGLVKKQ